MKKNICFLMMMLPFIALAQCPNNVVTNGSFSGDTGPTYAADGWTGMNTPDVNDVNSTEPTWGWMWSGVPVESPDGGTWQNIYFTETVRQTIQLEVGMTYHVQFYYAAQGLTSENYEIIGHVGVEMFLGDEPLFTTPLDTSFYSWEAACFTFTAETTTTELILSASTPYYVAVDGLCILAAEDLSQPFLGADANICEGDTLWLDASAFAGEYNWQDDTGSSSYEVTETGTYYVDINTGCFEFTDTVDVLVSEAVVFDLGLNQTICEGEEMVLDPMIATGTFEWQDGSDLASYTVTEAGEYWVTIATPCSTAADTISIAVIEEIDVDLGSDTVICSGESVVLNANISNVSYLWSDSTSGASLLVFDEGTYWLEVSNECFTARDEVAIDFQVQDSINFPSDTLLCEETQLQLDATLSNALNYSWQDGTELPFYNVRTPGLYTVQVDTECGIVYDQIQVNYRQCDCEVFMPDVFSPNGDGRNDVYLPFTDCVYTANYTFRIYNRWGGLLFESNNPAEAWDGTFSGESMPIGPYVYTLDYEFYPGEGELIHGNFYLMK
jgi:gliding motility-associated-like protein